LALFGLGATSDLSPQCAGGLNRSKADVRNRSRLASIYKSSIGTHRVHTLQSITLDHPDCGISPDQTRKGGIEWDFVQQSHWAAKNHSAMME